MHLYTLYISVKSVYCNFACFVSILTPRWFEVDGPSHFCGRTPTGATALKRRQLRAAGWALLPVPYWEWNDLSSSSARQEYLRAALQGAPSALAA